MLGDEVPAMRVSGLPHTRVEECDAAAERASDPEVGAIYFGDRSRKMADRQQAIRIFSGWRRDFDRNTYARMHVREEALNQFGRQRAAAILDGVLGTPADST